MLHLISFFICTFSCYLTPSLINLYLKYIDIKVLDIWKEFDFGTRAVTSVRYATFSSPFPSPSPHANTPVLFFQFPAVNHPQTLERRYLGILNSVLLDLMKVGQVDVVCIKCLSVCGFFCVCLHVTRACFCEIHVFR